MPQPPTILLRYDPAFDLPEKDEAETAESLAKTMLKIADKTFADTRHATRSVHAKAHGLVKAELEVLPNLPEVLAQGLFAKPGRYPVLMRFSTVPGDILGDKVSTPRGLAIKIIGVDGERLEDAPGKNQDFVLVNGPLFNAPSAKVFLANLKLLAATTDRAEGAKQVLSGVMRKVEQVVETFSSGSPLAKTLGGEPPNHILGETFFSQVPIRYGDYIAKVQVAPVSPDLTALTGKPVDLDESPDVLRDVTLAHFRAHGGVWELRVQLSIGLGEMPVDDPTKDWDEAKSPFIAVARITAAPQVAWSEARARAVDDGMGFSPWHGLQAHRPLGQIMRMRKRAYEDSQRFRSERNAVPVREPTDLDGLPD